MKAKTNLREEIPVNNGEESRFLARQNPKNFCCERSGIQTERETSSLLLVGFCFARERNKFVRVVHVFKLGSAEGASRGDNTRLGNWVNAKAGLVLQNWKKCM